MSAPKLSAGRRVSGCNDSPSGNPAPGVALGRAAATIPPTDDEVIAALREHGSNRKAAAALGLNESSIRKRLPKLAARGWSPDHQLVKPSAPGFMVKGTSTLYGPDGEVKAQWVKTREDAEAREAMLREACAAMVTDLPRVKPTKSTGKANGDLCACYPIGDAHIGMRSWAPETGKDWDLEIAERTQCAAMRALVEAAPDAVTAVIVNLGDWFHYDSMAAVTPTSGHHLDADGRYGKMIAVGIKVMRTCIEAALEKHESVRIINAIGNHDETGALWLAAALSHIYADEPRVTVDTSPSVFTYFEWGRCLVGVHHGHKAKMEVLPGVMAADRPEAWGRTRHRYWWLGHVHHQSVKELAGVVCESWNTLAANDAYGHSGGWRPRQRMSCVVLHREHGEVARFGVSPEMVAA